MPPTPTSTKCFDELPVQSRASDKGCAVRNFYLFVRDGNHVEHGSEDTRGWVQRFPTEAERDEEATRNKWHAWPLSSRDFRVRWSKAIAYWTGFPCRVDRAASIGIMDAIARRSPTTISTAISPYYRAKMEERARRAS